MAKKETIKKQSITKTASATSKKVSPKKKKTEKVKDEMSIVEVVVIAKQFGNYKANDTIKMVGSTANALIEHGVIELKK